LTSCIGHCTVYTHMRRYTQSRIGATSVFAYESPFDFRASQYISTYACRVQPGLSGCRNNDCFGLPYAFPTPTREWDLQQSLGAKACGAWFRPQPLSDTPQFPPYSSWCPYSGLCFSYLSFSLIVACTGPPEITI